MRPTTAPFIALVLAAAGGCRTSPVETSPDAQIGTPDAGARVLEPSSGAYSGTFDRTFSPAGCYVGASDYTEAGTVSILVQGNSVTVNSYVTCTLDAEFHLECPPKNETITSTADVLVTTTATVSKAETYWTSNTSLVLTTTRVIDCAGAGCADDAQAHEMIYPCADHMAGAYTLD
jgi:hypothetical protein